MAKVKSLWKAKKNRQGKIVEESPSVNIPTIATNFPGWPKGQEKYRITALDSAIGEYSFVLLGTNALDTKIEIKRRSNQIRVSEDGIGWVPIAELIEEDGDLYFRWLKRATKGYEAVRWLELEISKSGQKLDQIQLSQSGQVEGVKEGNVFVESLILSEKSQNNSLFKSKRLESELRCVDGELWRSSVKENKKLTITRELVAKDNNLKTKITVIYRIEDQRLSRELEISFPRQIGGSQKYKFEADSSEDITTHVNKLLDQVKNRLKEIKEAKPKLQQIGKKQDAKKQQENELEQQAKLDVDLVKAVENALSRDNPKGFKVTARFWFKFQDSIKPKIELLKIVDEL